MTESDLIFKSKIWVTGPFFSFLNFLCLYNPFSNIIIKSIIVGHEKMYLAKETICYKV